MKLKSAIAIVAIALNTTQLALAQEYRLEKDPRPAVGYFADDLSKLATTARQDSKLTENDTLVRGLLNHLDFTTMTQPDEFVRALALELAIKTAAESTLSYRPDKQLAAPSNSSGTTSLVSRAGASELLSLALDTGALTQSVNGSTATLNGNLDGLFRAVTGYSPLCVYPCPPLNGKNMQWVDNHILRPVNVSVVTTLAQQSSTTTAGAGQASGTTPTPVENVAIPTGAGKVTGVLARYQILNKYDPHSNKFKQKWQEAKDQQTFISSLLTANNNILAVRDRVLKTATPLDRAEILKAARQGDKALADYFWAYFERQVKNFSPDVSSAVAQAVQDIAASQQVWEKVREEAAGALFTLEYSYSHPLNQPETDDFKIIYGYAPGSVLGMLSINGTVSIYGGSLPPAAKYGRLRSGQVSAQYDRPFTVSKNPNLLTLSLAGYWQYQPNPSVISIPAGTVAPGTTIPLPNGTQEFVGTAGSLWVTQAKLTISTKSGIKIPIGVKWSNKTDLLSGNKVGAQVGINYDFSSLSSLFGGNTTK